jgi:hypothetical protein
MELLATSAEVWASIGTAIFTAVVLLPGIVYAWFVLESWIGDDDSYAPVIETIYKT